jgi:hypothetical protein
MATERSLLSQKEICPNNKLVICNWFVTSLVVKGWKEKIRNREQWRPAVEEAKAHPGL